MKSVGLRKSLVLGGAAALLLSACTSAPPQTPESQSGDAKAAPSGAVTAADLEVLQPGEGDLAGDFYLESTPDTVTWGRLPSAADKPVLEVPSGATVTVDTVSHEGLLDDQGSDPVAYFTGHGVAKEDILTDAITVAAEVDRDPKEDGPHVVTGPIFVKDAKPGDLLAITLLDATPRVPYGVVTNRHGKGALPDELPRGDDNVSVFSPVVERDGELMGSIPLTEGSDQSATFPLRPFLGIMGVATSDTERPNSIPPDLYGGNIDIAALQAGATVYIPVQVPGALAYVGDPHFAQGDGEVALTAMEGSLRVTVQFDVVPQEEALAEFGDFEGPMGSADGYLMPTGLDADLDEALRKSVRNALTILQTRYGMDEHLAYAYLSAATDFRISQVVDKVSGVHGMIRESDFDGLE